MRHLPKQEGFDGSYQQIDRYIQQNGVADNHQHAKSGHVLPLTLLL